MCLAVPMRVIEILENEKVKVELNKVSMNVSKALIKDISIGDFVLVHAGFIIEKVHPEKAKEHVDIYNELKKMVEEHES